MSDWRRNPQGMLNQDFHRFPHEIQTACGNQSNDTLHARRLLVLLVSLSGCPARAALALSCLWLMTSFTLKGEKLWLTLGCTKKLKSIKRAQTGHLRLDVHLWRVSILVKPLTGSHILQRDKKLNHIAVSCTANLPKKLRHAPHSVGPSADR